LLQTAATAGFSLQDIGFLAAIKLTDKSGYPDNGYPDMQTLPGLFTDTSELLLVSTLTKRRCAAK